MLEKNDVRRRNGRHEGASQMLKDTARETNKANGKTGRPRKAGPGLKIERFFTKAGDDGFTHVQWELRTATITGEDGKVVFEQKDVEVPRGWSQTATNVVVQKYFRGTARHARARALGAPAHRPRGRHHHRLGHEGRLLRRPRHRRENVPRRAAPPAGRSRRCRSTRRSGSTSASKPTRSARPASSTASTTRWSPSSALAKTEGMLFKYGSGTGTNLSPLRSSRELLVGGGTASGPVSFMKRLRRLRRRHQVGRQDPPRGQDGHPERRSPRRRGVHLVQGQGREEGLGADRRGLRRFVRRRGVQVGLLPELEQLGPRHRRVHGGRAEGPRVVARAPYATAGRVETLQGARAVARRSPQAAWECGDPGMQFDTTVNDWHTCSNTARINASNPCSEYMFLDDSACNLASLNLRKLRRRRRRASTSSRSSARSRLTILAQEIIVGNAKYPTKGIADNSLALPAAGPRATPTWARCSCRAGLPYDSDAGARLCGRHHRAHDRLGVPHQRASSRAT